MLHTQNIPEFNTQISITSLVGKRAVGKSTIASLLSGNETMFVTGSSTRGTTTVGADISTVIPTKDYAAIISKKLGKPNLTPEKTLPMFIVDSEGMNLRGDAFDFVTTSPPAVVAKMIIWVGEGTLQTAGECLDYFFCNPFTSLQFQIMNNCHFENPKVSCTTLANIWTAWIRSSWVIKPLLVLLVTSLSLVTLQSF